MGKLLTQPAHPAALMFYENHHWRGVDRERIMAIEYHLERPRIYVPFQVFTTGEDRPGKTYSLYDFEWCKRDQMLYYHNSGGGGRVGFYISAFSQRRKEPYPGALWWDRSITTPTDTSLKARKLSDATVDRWGYKILAKPLVAKTSWGRGTNPFDSASESETEYCSKCDDFFPTDQLCDHVWWCAACGDYSKPDERCKHRAN